MFERFLFRGPLSQDCSGPLKSSSGAGWLRMGLGCGEEGLPPTSDASKKTCSGDRPGPGSRNLWENSGGFTGRWREVDRSFAFFSIIFPWLVVKSFFFSHGFCLGFKGFGRRKNVMNTPSLPFSTSSVLHSFRFNVKVQGCKAQFYLVVQGLFPSSHCAKIAHALKYFASSVEASTFTRLGRESGKNCSGPKQWLSWNSEL